MPCVERERETTITSSEGVREMSQRILESSTDILTIDYKSLEKDLIPKLQEFQKAGSSESNTPANGNMSLENELGYRLFLDAINFCYKDPYTGQEYSYTDRTGGTIKRTYGLMTAMKESGVNWGNIPEVAELTPERWAEMIQLSQNDRFFLGEERGRRIKGLATQLLGKGFYDINQYINFHGYSSSRILTDLAQNGFFNDEFLKRAQLAIRDLNNVLRKFNKEEIIGTEKLTVMADYRLPQLNYNVGPIVLSESLKGKLKNEEIIESGSREELALRSAAVVIGKGLKERMNISEGDVDLLEWMLAVKMGKSNELTIPHMLVPTDKY